jgi:hypothetical protein
MAVEITAETGRCMPRTEGGLLMPEFRELSGSKVKNCDSKDAGERF